MSLFIKIKALKSNLSNSELKLADYTLEQPELIRSQSSIELAQASGVSQSSVVKFAQKLGYKGFPEFKFAVVDALNSQIREATPVDTFIHQQDSLQQIAEKLVLRQHGILKHTQQLNAEVNVDKVVSALTSAKRILIIAHGASSLIAREAAFKFQKLGLAAHSESDFINAANTLSGCSKDDVLFIISHSAQSKNLAKLVELAKQNGTQVVSLTKYAANPISELADHTIYSVTDDEPIPHSGILTGCSQSFVIDLLSIAIANSHVQIQKQATQANAYIESLGL